MPDPRVLPYADFPQDSEYAHLDTPERKLNLEILLRVIEDATLLCNKKYRASAVNWFTGVTKDPPVSFTDVCHSLELSQKVIQSILKSTVQYGKCETKGKSWRTRVC